jgi:hypothetical protein
MIHPARCNNEKCYKKFECYRYMAENYLELPLIEFEHICNEDNNYVRFYEIGDKSVRKLELKGE